MDHDEHDCEDYLAHSDSLTKLINDAIEKYALTISDVRKLRPGEKIDVLLFDRNIGDYIENHHKSTGDTQIDTRTYMMNNHLATFTQGQKPLTGKLFLVSVGDYIDGDWTWEINGERISGVYWHPLDCSDCDSQCTFKVPQNLSENTKVGWRGPAILADNIKDMPKYFTYYDRCSDDYAPVRHSDLTDIRTSNRLSRRHQSSRDDVFMSSNRISAADMY